MGFKLLLYSAILYSYNVTPHCITTRCIEHVQIIFIKTENIAVDEIGRIICSYLLQRAHTYFDIKLLCMNDTVMCNIVAHYSAVQ